MSLTRIVHVGDVHLADTPPGWRTEGYTNHILDKLAWIVSEAELRGAHYLLFAGDIFHHRSRVSHGLVADTADVLSGFNGHTYILAGNHDLRDNLLSSASRQPIGLLGRLPRVTVLAGRDSVPMGNIQLYPIPYKHGLKYEECRGPKQRRPKGKWTILWVHYGIVEDGSRFPYPTLDTSSPEWAPGKVDVVLSGHIHDNLGVWRGRTGELCINLGSISRGSLDADNLKRTPQVLFAEWPPSGTGKPVFESIDVPCLSASEVFRVEDRDGQRASDAIAEDFVRAVGETKLAVVSLEQVLAQVEQADAPKGVKEKAAQVLQEVW